MASRQAKEVVVRILCSAGKAAPTPPIGPALGAKGVKSMDFCKQFNASTAHIEPGTPIPTIITINPDRSFSFITRTPPTTWLLKQCVMNKDGSVGLDKGTGQPGKVWAGTVSLKHVYEIAKIKQKDNHMAHLDLEAISRMVVGSARSLGVQVVP